MPQRACVRCARPASRRRGGRPLCLACWVLLSEFESDKEARSMGKLKGTHGKR
ncbi:MAG: hypothetical protein WCE75_17780 [Terracidiphilus sp.]